MCGIVGYLGTRQAVPLLLEGLQHLEPRGYDSAGIAVVMDRELCRVRAEGKLDALRKLLESRPIDSTAGIAHTRWATHGRPSEVNAHPHANGDETVMVVHNGIIENHQTLREQLQARGYRFSSETDTEVLAHLIESEYAGDLTQAVKRALRRVTGTYGLAVVHAGHPDTVVAARRSSDLMLGIGKNEMFLASDPIAFARYTKDVVYLEDGDIVTVQHDRYTLVNLSDKPVPIQREAELIDWEPEAAELGDFPNFTLKEIFEQPETLTNAMRGRLILNEGIPHLGGLAKILKRLKKAKHLVIIGCGTSYYAGLYARHVFERLTELRIEVEDAGEFKSRRGNVKRGTVVIGISQSGKTEDLKLALEEAKRRGAVILGLVNVVGSTIARLTDAGVYNHGGPEQGVASTKIFTSQCVILVMIALLFGRFKQLSSTDGIDVIRGLQRLPEQVQAVLDQREHIHLLARKYQDYRNFLFIGRKYNHPMALEGALKLKELSYIHAEGCAASEMKHGFIAMIDENFPTVCLATDDMVRDKTLGNAYEIKSRGGKVIIVATEGDEEAAKIADDIIYTPKNLDFLQPITAVVALQLFAYYCALELKRDIDHPRNLAKSVTVE